MKAFSDLSEIMDCRTVQLQGGAFSATVTPVELAGDAFRFGRKGHIEGLPEDEKPEGQTFECDIEHEFGFGSVKLTFLGKSLLVRQTSGRVQNTKIDVFQNGPMAFFWRINPATISNISNQKNKKLNVEFSERGIPVVFKGLKKEGDIFKKISMENLFPLLRERGCAVV